MPRHRQEYPLVQRTVSHALHDAVELKEDEATRFIAPLSVDEIWQKNFEEFFSVYQTKYNWPLNSRSFIWEKLLKTVSILIYIRWQDWRNFQDTFLQVNSDGQFTARLTDKTWPIKEFQQLELLDFLEKDVLQPFHSAQFIFYPVVLEQHKLNSCFAWSRLPLKRLKLIGEGGFGRIYEEKIARGCYVGRTGRANREEKRIARKVINTQSQFHNESENFDKLANSITNNKLVMKSIGTISRPTSNGIEFSILYDEVADMDLRHFLLGPKHGYPEFAQRSREARSYHEAKPREIMNAMRNLASAIASIHTGLRNDDDGQLFGAHNDLKPENVLLVYDKKSPCGRWKITDFGMTAFKIPHQPDQSEGNGSQDKLFSIHQLFPPTTNKIPPGQFTAPERGDDNSHNRTDSQRGDVWALGCILCYVLAYICGGKPCEPLSCGPCRKRCSEECKSKPGCTTERTCGPRKVHELHQILKTGSKSHWEYFYDNDWNLKQSAYEWLCKLEQEHGDKAWVIACVDAILTDVLQEDTSLRISAEVLIKRLDVVVALMDGRAPPYRAYSRRESWLERIARNPRNKLNSAERISSVDSIASSQANGSLDGNSAISSLPTSPDSSAGAEFGLIRSRTSSSATRSKRLGSESSLPPIPEKEIESVQGDPVHVLLGTHARHNRTMLSPCARIAIFYSLQQKDTPITIHNLQAYSPFDNVTSSAWFKTSKQKKPYNRDSKQMNQEEGWFWKSVDVSYPLIAACASNHENRDMLRIYEIDTNSDTLHIITQISAQMSQGSELEAVKISSTGFVLLVHRNKIEIRRYVPSKPATLEHVQQHSFKRGIICHTCFNLDGTRFLVWEKIRENYEWTIIDCEAPDQNSSSGKLEHNSRAFGRSEQLIAPMSSGFSILWTVLHHMGAAMVLGNEETGWAFCRNSEFLEKVPLKDEPNDLTFATARNVNAIFVFSPITKKIYMVKVDPAGTDNKYFEDAVVCSQKIEQWKRGGIPDVAVRTDSTGKNVFAFVSFPDGQLVRVNVGHYSPLIREAGKR